MRVLFVSPYYKPAHLGGIERAIERLARALWRQPGIERIGLMASHYAFPPRYVAGLPAHETIPGELEVYRLDSVPHTPLPLFPYYSCPVTVFTLSSMRRVLRDFRPDVIHIVGDGWVWIHAGLLALRGPETAAVLTPSFHDATGTRAWLRVPYTVMCRQVERIAVLTDHERRGVARAYRAPARRFVRVPWGVDIPLQGLIRPAPALPESPATILCVGRLGEHKGQMWLLDVYARARRRFTRRTRLVLVGADEGDAGGRMALERRIAAEGLRNEVDLTGEVPDDELQRRYAAADLFALFSRYEAFGLVFVEAMAHGVPVLTHRVGANAEVLARGAVVTARYALDEAVESLARLVDDEDERRLLGDEARRYVADTFSWDAVALRYMQVYKEAIDERRGCA